MPGKPGVREDARQHGPTTKLQSIFLPESTGQLAKGDNRHRSPTSSRKGVLDYLDNLAYRAESRYWYASELATDVYVVSERTANGQLDH